MLKSRKTHSKHHGMSFNSSKNAQCRHTHQLTNYMLQTRTISEG